MTIVRYQIHCLVSKNDAVIIVIEDDCDATLFQRRCAQERSAHSHRVKCGLDQNSFSTVRHHVSENYFLSIMLQCHVVCCHCLNMCRTHHGANRNIQNRSSTRLHQSCNRTDLPSSPCVDVSCCLPARISRVRHRRIQSCSLETNLGAMLTCGVSSFLRLVYCCRCH